MERRSFFAALTGTLAAAKAKLVATPVEEKKPYEIAPKFYRGYYIHWTGWKGADNVSFLVGQWVGYPVTDPDRWTETEDTTLPWLYSSVPGGCGAHAKLYTFDISLHPGQCEILANTSAKIKNEQMERGAKKLMRIIDFVVDSTLRNRSAWAWNNELSRFGFEKV